MEEGGGEDDEEEADGEDLTRSYRQYGLYVFNLELRGGGMGAYEG